MQQGLFSGAISGLPPLSNPTEPDMRASFLVCLIAFVGAGCQSAAEKHAAETGEIEAANVSMSEVSGLLKAARPKMAMQPGEWEVSMQVVSADLSAMPEASRAEQMAAIKRQERAATKCQKTEDLKPLDIDLEKVAGTCTFPRYISKGGRLDVEIACSPTGGPVTKILAKGLMSKTGFDVMVDQQTAAAGDPRYLALKLRARGKRLGECKSQPS
jgi:hypothetical protein